MRHPRRIALALLLVALGPAALDGAGSALARARAWAGIAETDGASGDEDRAAGLSPRRSEDPRSAERVVHVRRATTPSRAGGRSTRAPEAESTSPEAPEAPEAGPTSLALATAGEGDGVTVRLAVRDPDGPREVWLWRLRDGREAVAARTVTGADGAGFFPPLVRSNEDLVLVATPAGLGPADPGASRAMRLAARAPEPPSAQWLGEDDGAIRLRVTPTEADADVVLAGPDGEEFARFGPGRGPHAARRPLDLDVALPDGDGLLLVAHERADGRRSRWRSVSRTPTNQPTGRR